VEWQLTGAIRNPEPTPRCHGVTLEGFSAAVRNAEGLAVTTLSPIDQLSVRTRNSWYHITVVDPLDSQVVVQGGAFFPLPRQARLSGATLGGSMLRVGWIACGFSLELQCGGQSIVTTPVCEIRRGTSSVSPRPC
jgi:hypothetical protein